MKLGLLVAAAAVAIAFSPAQAADLPVKARPAPVPIATYNWTGFYVGANGGLGWSQKCWFSVNRAADESCNSPQGGLYGGQVGFNWQTGSLVLGVELAGDWGKWQASSPALSPIVGLHSEVNRIVSLAARFGWAWNNVLLYGKGGAAWVRDYYFEDILGTPATEASETRSGWLAGVGLEYGFTPNWSAAIEYDYIGLGNRTLAFTTIASPNTFAFNENIRQKLQMLTLRVNYRFSSF